MFLRAGAGGGVVIHVQLILTDGNSGGGGGGRAENGDLFRRIFYKLGDNCLKESPLLPQR